MNQKRSHLRLPALTTAGSFFVLALTALLTSPVKNITWAAVFFIALLAFLVSLGYLLVSLQTGSLSLKSRFRIWIISLFILMFLMFRSAQSLNWVDGLVLLLIVFGLLFYSSRR